MLSAIEERMARIVDSAQIPSPIRNVSILVSTVVVPTAAVVAQILL